MSGETVTRYVLKCDGGCGIELGRSGEYENAMEARADAYGKGWRFPGQVKKGGAPSTRTSDVCPECLPGFKPQEANDTWKNKRNPDGSVGAR
jgi:hypothetical protein